MDKYGQVLAYFGLNHENTEVLVDAAAVGLVADVWRDGPLDAIHAAGTGPSNGEIFAQSVDLYRTARAALLAARDGGPEELFVFQTIASDVRLRWAGGSSFTLMACGEPTEEFCQYVDSGIWFTGKQMKELGWRTALMHRAVSAAVKTPGHFGMPGWPAVAATALRRFGALDRAGAPGTLHDLRSRRSRAPRSTGPTGCGRARLALPPGRVRPGSGRAAVNWDGITIGVLAAFGCVMLVLTQIREVLAKLPELIRAWRRVRQELAAPLPDPDGHDSEPDTGTG
ncbi:hypothetical protein F4556_005412 [Kitasatospora gansuensis]|uniref:Uncharacterized protein n=1 Tax=Kitasatospora gansuensis TaxID=258050 RepID=A0A7W7SGD4_9ACTN|nr:hypothetical protein [Kitasatospora gansuensis]MBB4949877.1 hypothetical protein [Kitasatospora gansuensis]